VEDEQTRAASMVSLRRGLSLKRVTPRAGLITWLDGWVGCEADRASGRTRLVGWAVLAGKRVSPRASQHFLWEGWTVRVRGGIQ